MKIPRQAQSLRIFIGENDRTDGQPLYEAIVLKAREMQIAGATVLRGAMGYGHSSRLLTSKIRTICLIRDQSRWTGTEDRAGG